MMTKEKQIKAAARLDGLCRLEQFDGSWEGYDPKTFATIPCDYLHDHNSIQRLIDRLSDGGLDKDSEYDRYLTCLRDIVGYTYLTQKATCGQKLEAILRATYKWKTG